ncbi:unnamed protein product [Polarella glacialis]|uniref:EXS domain-containing protein n=1 Tax=Polarella glacialis TaxID=89957 RepID=A0A813HDZ2_POLGL|nr:unnamed protein product [Polarella glacialis]
MYFCTMVYVMYWTRATLPRLVAGAVASLFTAAGVAPIDGLVGNLLCSLTKPIVEVTNATCFYVTGEVWGKCYDWTNGRGVNLGLFILVLPNFLRFAQNMRQFYDTGKRHPCVTNAFKYLLSMSVTLFSLVHKKNARNFKIWLGLSVCQVTYSFAWDLTMDWGLFKSRRGLLCLPCGKIHLRRRRLLGTGVWPYVLAIVADFFGRIFFVYTLVPKVDLDFASAGYRTLRVCFFLAPSVEILRRSMWCVLSFEYKWLDQLRKGVPQPTARQDTFVAGLAAGVVQSRHMKAELAVAMVVALVMIAVAVLPNSI